MTGSTANGNGKPGRPGAQVLCLLASPLSFQILSALREGPVAQVDLRRACGMPAQSTLRAQLRKLDALGAIQRQRNDGFAGTVEHELTGAGQELLEVAETLRVWLRTSPEGPLDLGASTAKAAVNAFVEGWSTGMMRALAAKPLSLTELDRLISSLAYPSLERRLAAMRLSGQIQARKGNGRGTPYAVTEWCRLAVAPLLAATRWEHRHIPEQAAPIASIDTETSFLLAMPLLELPDELSGSSRMAVEVSSGRGHALAGVLVEAREGRIASCTTRLEGHPDAWVSGSVSAWLTAAVDGDVGTLELGGDSALARSLLGAMHGALSGVVVG